MEDTARNRFRVVGQIGRGSIADVYLCRLQGAAGFEKDVALKRIHADHSADPLFVRMFLDEARVVAKVNHANIAQVFEVGEDEEGPYIAMEYVRGVSLATVIARAHAAGKIHHGHAVRIMAGICDGLVSAHTAADQDGAPLGIIHRDVRPTTIVVTIDGIPKLLDFGTATVRGRLSNTQVAAFKKNLRYMAPEQISQGPVDQRADVYGLGVTLYELTTGRNPFGTDADPEVQVLDRILDGDFARPSEVAPGYPAELEAIVLSAMATEVEARFPSARELRDRLESFSSARDHSSTPTALAGWLRQLFPDFSAIIKAAATPVPRSTRSLPAIPAPGSDPIPVPAGETQVTVPLRPRPPSGGGRGWAAVTFLALAVAAAIWFYRQSTLVPATLPPPEAASTAASSVAGQRAARAYLDAVETFIREQRYPLAREALIKAAETTVAGTDLDRRLTRLRERVDAELAATAARTPDLEIDTLPGAPSVRVAVPSLPRTFVSKDGQRLSRMCQKVEAELVARARVSPAFARGITSALRRRIRPSSPIFPAAMYYFIAREVALGRNRNTAAGNLATAQVNGGLRSARDLTPATVP